MPTLAKFRRDLEKSKPLRMYSKGGTVKGGGKMGLLRNYSYLLEANPGQDFAERFAPRYSPQEMLEMGVFEGKYLNDSLLEFPAEWYWNALQLDKLRPDKSDVGVNLMGVDSRQPLTFWKESGWVPSRLHTSHKAQHPELSDSTINKDERGWFQWYCRYWIGRRIPELDQIQISRWKAFTRHAGQIKANCSPGVITCRPRQRQGLFQWAHNPFI
jgi:hypothetical protein